MTQKYKYNAFICHASEDKDEIVRPLAAALLQKGLRIWYDEFSLTVGDSLRRAIDKGLTQSKYGIVVLSRAFFEKDWLQKELDGLAAREQDGQKIILPVWHNIGRKDIVRHSPLLADRVAVSTSKGLDRVAEELCRVLGPPSEALDGPAPRALEKGSITPMEIVKPKRGLLPVGGISLPLPCFFPSISSIKTYLTPLEYLKVLLGLDHSLLFVSSYDVFYTKEDDRNRISNRLREAHRDGKIILLDSGYYESSHKGDRNWSVKSFRQITKSLAFNITFCFDKRLDRKNKESMAIKVNRIEAQVLADQKHCPGGTVVPVVHSDAEAFPEICAALVQRLNPVLIAVPERELGDGILARARNIAAIRKALNETGHYYPLHLLGTGNPRSIALFTYCGADSFDGLEWCQTTVDHNTGLLYHFHQREIFGAQSQFCTATEIPYIQATLGHNLLFYLRWMEMLQAASSSNDLEQVLRRYFPDSFLDTLETNLLVVVE